LRRLLIVAALVLITAVGYRSFGGEETATGTLTLPQPAPIVGQDAPRFTATTESGEEFTLSDRGVYVLTFWSTLNQGSVKARPGFTRLAEEYGDEGVTFVAVYVNNAPPGEPYVVLQGRRGYLTSLYNVKRVPRLFLIQDGKITLVQNDYFDENDEQLEARLKESLREEDRETGKGSE
jgi:thiol-disulfide isomerase/thioredoxin